MTPTEIEKLPEWIGLVASPFGFRLWNKEADSDESNAIKYIRGDLHLAAIEVVQRENQELRAADRDHAAARAGMEARLNAALEAKDAEIERAKELSAQSNKLRDEWRTEALNLRLEIERKGHSLEAAEAALKEAREGLSLTPARSAVLRAAAKYDGSAAATQHRDIWAKMGDTLILCQCLDECLDQIETLRALLQQDSGERP